jgi:hypothetical protein
MKMARIRINKKVDDPIIEKVKFDYNNQNETGSLEIHFKSGIIYKYKDVSKESLDALLEKDAFVAHQYNKYIHSRYSASDRIKTDKYFQIIKIERKKQYLAKNNAARRARKQKARETKQKELTNA